VTLVMSHSENNNLTLDSSWDNDPSLATPSVMPLVEGMTAMCCNCQQLIIVVNRNPHWSDPQPNLGWVHRHHGFAACGKPATLPQAEPFIGPSEPVNRQPSAL